MTKFKIFKEEIFILWELHSKILVGDKNYVSTATFFLLHCDEWNRVVALPRHKFVTGATLLQLGFLYRTRIKCPTFAASPLSSQ
jgi:hypothetical protein